MQSRMEKSPGDAHAGERLHHFEVAGGGCAGPSPSFKINEKGDTAGNRGKKNKRTDGGAHVRLRRWRPKGSAIQFSVNEQNERHADESERYLQTRGQPQWHSEHRAAPGDGRKSPE